MTTGDLIRDLRNGNNKYGKKLTQDALGAALNPPVKRAAVNKWETNLVKNIKKYYIEQIAEIFGVTPNELMCFEDNPPISDEITNYKTSQIVLDKDATQLLLYFYELNDAGKNKALETIKDLVDHPKYKHNIQIN